MILRCFDSWPRPPVSWLTTFVLNARSRSTSIFGAPNVTPHASACCASLMTSATCSSAFDGMQPAIQADAARD